MAVNILEGIEDNGYMIFQNILPNKNWFREIYSSYDTFVDTFLSINDNEIKLKTLANEWLNEENNISYYCGAPPAYKERIGKGGKDVKDYLQWFLNASNNKIFQNSEAGNNKEFQKISKKLETLHTICSEIFWNALHNISEKYPQLILQYDTNIPLPIIFKIIRYKKNSDTFGTPPHYDKSALSLILDSDDTEVRWRVGKGNNVKLSEMKSPIEYPKDNKSSNHTILFPGLCLKEINVAIEPTPHCVMPVNEKDKRHSIIAFLLLPNLKGTDKLTTKANYIHDININIR